MSSLKRSTERRVILITGGCSRIGAAISRYFCLNDWDIVVHSQSFKKADLFAGELRRISSPEQSITAISFNVGNLAQIEDAFKNKQLLTLKFDAIVHNASSFFATPLATLDTKQWDALMQSNALGPLLLTKTLLKHNHLKPISNIISILDIHALGQPYQNHVIYNMAKAAHTAMVASLAKDLAPNIRVNGIAPGAILWPEPHSEGAISLYDQAEILSSIPMRRLGQPEDIAHAAWFLANAAYVTGQIIKVDGGRSLTISGERYDE